MTEILKGKALQERARELNIQGRSKLTADQLRDEVRYAERLIEEIEETEAITIPTEPAQKPSKAVEDKGRVVMNRKDRRAAERASKLNNRGFAKGGRVKAAGPRTVPVGKIHDGH